MRVYDKLYVGGSWRAPSTAERIAVANPATGEAIAAVPAGTATDVDRAVEAAAEAFPGWSATPVRDRAALLDKIAEALADRADEIATLVTQEVGTPLPMSRQTQAGLPVADIRAVAEVLDDFPWTESIPPSIVVREAVGVVGAITPWNYPLHQITAKVGAALAAGCTLVVKPSEIAPSTAFVLADILDSAGLPPGVVNIVTGYGPTAGEAIAGHPGVDMVSFTGSVPVGQRVMQLAAEGIKRVALELGGKSATVVLDDADLDVAIPDAVAGCMRNSGQNCSALSRLLVPRARLGEIEERVVAEAATWTPGDPFDPATRLGPLVTARQRDRVVGFIRTGIAEGARLLAGGPEPPAGLDRGYFVAATVFSDVTADMTVAREEIFGPVLSILGYDTEEHAVRLANDSDYGLSGAVWSADPARATAVARRLRTGRVAVNGGRFNAGAPFGGYRRSGLGRELGRYGLEEFLEAKTLQL
jgi:acyl-CoA reductase-like NAD-dependent aldehyde dehydrogenase